MGQLKLAGLVTFCALACGPVFGHAKLVRSSPGDNARMMFAPKTLMLTFNEPVQLTALKLAGPNKDVPVVVKHAAKAGAEIKVPLPLLLPGRYTVQWSASTASDGHVVNGTLSFSVRAAGQMWR